MYIYTNIEYLYFMKKEIIISPHKEKSNKVNNLLPG